MKRCDACGVELTPVFPDLCRRRDDTQYDNALVVEFGFGYGMFDDPIDRLGRMDVTAIICHDCAHKLIDTNPWIGRFVDAERGHVHIDDQRKRHIFEALREDALAQVDEDMKYLGTLGREGES